MKVICTHDMRVCTQGIVVNPAPKYVRLTGCSLMLEQHSLYQYSTANANNGTVFASACIILL